MIIQFGAGSAGRAILAPEFRKLGSLTLVDSNQELVKFLQNHNGSYSVRLQPFDRKPPRTIKTGAFLVLHRYGDEDEIVGILGDPKTQIIITSVRYENLLDVAKVVGKGLHQRTAESPLILVCENTMGGAAYFRDLIEGFFPGVTNQDSFPDVVIDSIVPTQSISPIIEREDFCWMKIEDNGHRVLRKVSSLPNVDVVTNLADWHLRKFWGVNTFHLVLGLLGVDRGIKTVQEVVNNQELSPFIKSAKKEIAQAISLATGFSYDASLEDLRRNLKRSANLALGDTTDRLARDLGRKLTSGERLVRPALTILEKAERVPEILSGVIALGVLHHSRQAAEHRPAGIVDSILGLPDWAGKLRESVIDWLHKLIEAEKNPGILFPSDVLIRGGDKV